MEVLLEVLPEVDGDELSVPKPEVLTEDVPDADAAPEGDTVWAVVTVSDAPELLDTDAHALDESDAELVLVVETLTVDDTEPLSLNEPLEDTAPLGDVDTVVVRDGDPVPDSERLASVDFDGDAVTDAERLLERSEEPVGVVEPDRDTEPHAELLAESVRHPESVALSVGVNVLKGEPLGEMDVEGVRDTDGDGVLLPLREGEAQALTAGDGVLQPEGLADTLGDAELDVDAVVLLEVLIEGVLVIVDVPDDDTRGLTDAVVLREPDLVRAPVFEATLLAEAHWLVDADDEPLSDGDDDDVSLIELDTEFDTRADALNVLVAFIERVARSERENVSRIVPDGVVLCDAEGMREPETERDRTAEREGDKEPEDDLDGATERDDEPDLVGDHDGRVDAELDCAGDGVFREAAERVGVTATELVRVPAPGVRVAVLLTTDGVLRTDRDCDGLRDMRGDLLDDTVSDVQLDTDTDCDGDAEREVVRDAARARERVKHALVDLDGLLEREGETLPVELWLRLAFEPEPVTELVVVLDCDMLRVVDTDPVDVRELEMDEVDVSVLSLTVLVGRVLNVGERERTRLSVERAELE